MGIYANLDQAELFREIQSHEGKRNGSLLVFALSALCLYLTGGDLDGARAIAVVLCSITTTISIVAFWFEREAVADCRAEWKRRYEQKPT